jgi:hypothetical protein
VPQPTKREKAKPAASQSKTFAVQDPSKPISNINTAQEALGFSTDLNIELRNKIVLKPPIPGKPSSEKTTTVDFYERFTMMALAQQAACIDKLAELFAKIPLPEKNPGFFAAANCPM